jgi:4-methylaminobutanoate oxidase (formaldehyde-forming)
VERGLKQRLACLVIADSRVVALGKEPIRPYGTDQIIGWVATGGYGYSIEKSIVYAYLPIDYTLPGIDMEIEFFGEWVRAQVVRGPLFDPRGERVRA